MTPEAKKVVLMVAGGTGTRMQSQKAKQLLTLAGKPVIAHTFNQFHTSFPNVLYCLVLFEGLEKEWENCRKTFLPWLGNHNLIMAKGGAERTDSVRNGLTAIQASGLVPNTENCLVAIHDAVRPLISEKVIRQSFLKAAELGNAVVSVPVKSSLRRIENGKSYAVDRNDFFHVQTPQIFRLDKLIQWYGNAPHNRFTDDASLAEHFGETIFLTEGNYENLKITTPEDLGLAEILLAKKVSE